MEERKCVFIRDNSQPCNAWATADADFCYFHDPLKTQERIAASAAGGRARGLAALSPETPALPVRSAADVATLLEDTINDVRRGRIHPRVAYAVGFLATIQLKAIAQSVVEERLSGLERVVQDANDPSFTK